MILPITVEGGILVQRRIVFRLGSIISKAQWELLTGLTGKLNLNTGLWIRVEGRFLMTANRLCLMKKICHQKGNMKRLMFIILHMGVIILRVCVIFINYRGLFLFFQDTLLETGGAGIGNTVKKVILSCWRNLKKEIYHFPLLLWIWTGI